MSPLEKMQKERKALNKKIRKETLKKYNNKPEVKLRKYLFDKAGTILRANHQREFTKIYLKLKKENGL